MHRVRNKKSHTNNISNITQDQLLFVSDLELKKIYLDIRGRINKRRRNKQSTKYLEIDLCYVQRELQNRKEAKK
mgnify:FL=1